MLLGKPLRPAGFGYNSSSCKSPNPLLLEEKDEEEEKEEKEEEKEETVKKKEEGGKEETVEVVMLLTHITEMFYGELHWLQE